jgi:hypothetical protein
VLGIDACVYFYIYIHTHTHSPTTVEALTRTWEQLPEEGGNDDDKANTHTHIHTPIPIPPSFFALLFQGNVHAYTIKIYTQPLHLHTLTHTNTHTGQEEAIKKHLFEAKEAFSLQAYQTVVRDGSV